MRSNSCTNPTQMKFSSASALRSVISRQFRRIITLLERWEQRNHNRQTMAQMGEHLRKDIGLSQRDWKREIAKPFWRD